MNGSIRQRGKTYSYYFRAPALDGTYRRVEKGGYPTKKDATKALQEALAKYNYYGTVGAGSTMTVDELFKYWYETSAQGKLRPKTLVNYDSTYNNHIKPKIGKRKVIKLNVMVLQMFVNEVRDKVSGPTLGNIRNVLNGMLKLACRQGMIAENPLKDVEVRIKPSKRELKINMDQFKELDARLRESYAYLPFCIAFYTGMRIGEVCGLQWQHVDFKKNEITVAQQLQVVDKRLVLAPLKSKSSYRKIKFNPALRLILDQAHTKHLEMQKVYVQPLYNPDGFVCVDPGGFGCTPLNVSTRVTRAAESLGLDFRFHDLRHLHATLLFEADVNALVIQERLGHANIKTTLGTYTHLTKKMRDDTLDRIDSALKF